LERRGTPSKNLLIPLFPNFPSSYCKNLHKEVKLPLPFSFHDCVEEIKPVVPVNAQVIPTSFTEKALEDQMVSTFLDVQVAQHTVVVISFYLEVFLFSRFLEFILSLKRRQMKIFNLFVTLAFHIHLKGSGASMNLNLRA
jgi:hypothetical protein